MNMRRGATGNGLFWGSWSVHDGAAARDGRRPRSGEPRIARLAAARLSPPHEPEHDGHDADDGQEGDDDAHDLPLPTFCGAAEPVRRGPYPLGAGFKRLVRNRAGEGPSTEQRDRRAVQFESFVESEQSRRTDEDVKG
jgi:hypothetical protein